MRAVAPGGSGGERGGWGWPAGAASWPWPLPYARGRDRRSVIRRMVPRTHTTIASAFIGGPGVVPAAASVPAGHRLGAGSPGWSWPVRPGRARRLPVTVIGSVIFLLAAHLGPGETGELARDCGQGHPGWLAAGGQRLISGVQPPLGVPGAGQGVRAGAGLAAAQPGADRGLVPVRPRSLDQGGAGRPGPGLGDRTAADPAAAGVPGGTSPVNPMNARAQGNRRQSATSAPG